jgi:hypothetical protein
MRLGRVREERLDLPPERGKQEAVPEVVHGEEEGEVYKRHGAELPAQRLLDEARRDGRLGVVRGCGRTPARGVGRVRPEEHGRREEEYAHACRAARVRCSSHRHFSLETP